MSTDPALRAQKTWTLEGYWERRAKQAEAALAAAEAAPLHPDDGYAYEGCEGFACRTLRAEAAPLDAALREIEHKALQHITPDKRHWFLASDVRVALAATSRDS